jgi:glucokinase
VLAGIRANAPVSRAEIGRLTSVSAPTVSSIVAELLAQGIVGELPAGASEGGRPPRLLVFSDNVLYVGCDLSTSGVIRLGLVNLRDEVIDVRSVDYPESPPDPHHVVELIATHVEGWLEHRGCGARVEGIGIGAPGVTDVERGVVHWAANLSWSEVPLADLVGVRLGIPTVVDNDVNLALLGEVSQGVACSTRHAVLASFRDGVGGAVLIDGRLYRGRGAAGEIGYLVTTWPGAEPLREFGASERRIKTLLRDELAARGEGGDASDLEMTALVSRLLTDEGEFALSPGTERALAETIASCLASVVALLDPEIVVLSGWIENLSERQLGEISDALSLLVPSSVPPLRLSELGPTATLAGAGISAHRASMHLAEVVRAR